VICFTVINWVQGRCLVSANCECIVLWFFATVAHKMSMTMTMMMMMMTIDDCSVYLLLIINCDCFKKFYLSWNRVAKLTRHFSLSAAMPTLLNSRSISMRRLVRCASPSSISNCNTMSSAVSCVGVCVSVSVCVSQRSWGSTLNNNKHVLDRNNMFPPRVLRSDQTDEWCQTTSWRADLVWPPPSCLGSVSTPAVAIRCSVLAVRAHNLAPPQCLQTWWIYECYTGQHCLNTFIAKGHRQIRTELVVHWLDVSISLLCLRKTAIVFVRLNQQTSQASDATTIDT